MSSGFIDTIERVRAIAPETLPTRDEADQKEQTAIALDFAERKSQRPAIAQDNYSTPQTKQPPAMY